MSPAAPPATGWIKTFTGKRFYPMDPRAADIDIKDIAHALSQQCRFSGHTREFYSVAQHSFLVARHVYIAGVPGATARAALLHDAAEAYLVDVPRPIKGSLLGYAQAENRIAALIAKKFNATYPWPACVLGADDRMGVTEALALMNGAKDWDVDLSNPIQIKVTGWPPATAEAAFLQFFNRLKERR